MYGSGTENVILWRNFLDSFKTYKWCIITELERKVDFQNYPIGCSYFLRIDFFKLLNNDDKKM